MLIKELQSVEEKVPVLDFEVPSYSESRIFDVSDTSGTLIAGVVIDFLGAGGIGTLAGIGVSAWDTFLLDKISKGWRPDSFVNKELEKFLS